MVTARNASSVSPRAEEARRSWGLSNAFQQQEGFCLPPFPAPEAERPASPAVKPSLGQLIVTDATPDSLRLSWTVPEGQFDHFLVQYKNGDGQPKAVRVPGHEDTVTISGLEPDHKYKMNLYGFHDGQRQGPVSAIGVTGEWTLGAQCGSLQGDHTL